MKPELWGFLAGVIVAAFIAVPLSASVAFATHPETRLLFTGKLSDASAGAYSAFWWVAAIFFVALPFLAGFAVAKLSTRTLGIVGGIIIVGIVALLILAQVSFF